MLPERERERKRTQRRKQRELEIFTTRAATAAMTDINADRDSRSADESVRSSLKPQFSSDFIHAANT